MNLLSIGYLKIFAKLLTLASKQISKTIINITKPDKNVLLCTCFQSQLY